MKKRYSFFFILIVVYFFKFNLYASEKIAFIDLNIVFNQSNYGQAYNKDLNYRITSLNKKIKEYQNLINTEKIEIEKKKNVISDNDHETLLKSLDNKIINFNEIVNNEQKDIEKFKVTKQKIFLDSLLPILETYSIDQSIDIILKKENLLIAKKNLDITNELVILINKSKIKDN